MKKRAMVLRRRMIRKAVFGLVVMVLLSIETLAMTQVFRPSAKATYQPTVTIDLGTVFQGR